MAHIDFLTERFAEAADGAAVVWRDEVYSYAWLLERIRSWQERIREEEIGSGCVVALEGDFSPNTIALMFALIEAECITVPAVKSIRSRREQQFEIARVQAIVTVDDHDEVSIAKGPYDGAHPLYDVLRERGRPGLVVFTSGSTGVPKAAVHDWVGTLEKFRTRRPAMATVTFLLFDHLGGINTVLHMLSNGATVITLDSREPDRVCELIEKFRAELLPVTPTFLNLMLLSGAHKQRDLSSLKVISYGAEAMPESTLQRMARLFPDVRLQQTYGLIELGALRTKSKSSDSLWLRVGGEGYQTRVVDGMLQIKAKSAAMLGYMNAPSPFTDDGWFMTGDAVEVDGDYIRVLGRKSELINVGGEKLYPAEVENVIQEMDNVAEVTVRGEPNPMLGNIVHATVTLQTPEDKRKFARRLKKYCRERLQSYQVPVKVEVIDEKQHSGRFKKIRAKRD
jgi:acyl-CoA synthetase (AMP-forming)/AMP-acid ligase II